MSDPSCDAKLTPVAGDPDPHVYTCNREPPHTNLHAHLGPDGETVAIWCTCGECDKPQDDLL